jgi:mono/diheme cytochrome c family protein
MKKNIAVAAVALLGLFAVSFAQDEQQFQTWMKDNAATTGKLRKQVEAKANSEVATDAKHLEGVYKEIAAFFEKRGAADAVKIASDSQKASAELAAAATAGDADKMAASMKVITGGCAGCHMAHREKVEGGFKVK